jgi:hypothetical protein
MSNMCRGKGIQGGYHGGYQPRWREIRLFLGPDIRINSIKTRTWKRVKRALEASSRSQIKEMDSEIIR